MELEASHFLTSDYPTELHSTQNSILLAQKQTHTEITETKESPVINPCIYGQLIYNKGGKNIQRGKESLQKETGITGQLYVKK